MSSTVLEVAAQVSELGFDGGAPRRVKLLPIGTIVMRDGRGPYQVRDKAHADRIVAATRAWLGAADFNFDYGHAVQRDEAAIAAGWAKGSSITAEADGIYAQVEWTDAAAAKIKAREYRYLSPLFLASKSSGDVIQLKNAALVNIGAIDLPAVAASLMMGAKWENGDQVALSLDDLRRLAAGSATDAQMALTYSEQMECRNLGWDYQTYLAQKIRQMELAQSDGVSAGAQMLTPDEIAVYAALGMDHAEFASAKPSGEIAPAHLSAHTHPSAEGLSKDEVAACAALGLDQKDFAAAKRDEFERGARTKPAQHPMAAAAEKLLERLRGGALPEHLISPQELEMCRLMKWTPAAYLSEKIGAATGRSHTYVAAGIRPLSREERHVCELMGMNESDFIATRSTEHLHGSLDQSEHAACAALGISTDTFVAAKAEMNAVSALTKEERWACNKLGFSEAEFIQAKRAVTY